MRIGVDYCGFDPRFPAGMHNFSLGLTKGLLKSVDPPDSIVILATPQNENELRKAFAHLPVSLGRLMGDSPVRAALLVGQIPPASFDGEG